MRKLFLTIMLVFGFAGLASAALLSYGYETVTVPNTATALTASLYQKTSNVSQQDTEEALITCETAQIRYRFDGVAPTSTEGHILDVGQSLVVDGYKNIQNFKAIRTGATSGVLKITYQRQP